MLQVKLRVKWKVWGLHSFKVSRRYKTWSKQKEYYNTVSHTPRWDGLQKRHANVRKSISTFSRSIIFPFLRITVTLMFLSVSRNAYSISKPSAYDADDSDVSDVLNHDHLPGKRPLCTGCIQMRTDCAGMKKMRKGSWCGFWSNLIAWTSNPKFRKWNSRGWAGVCSSFNNQDCLGTASQQDPGQ